MCFQCFDEIGVRIGWYEIPPDFRTVITTTYPNFKPIPYVKVSSGVAQGSLGYPYEEVVRVPTLEHGWYKDCSAAVRRCSPLPQGNYVTIIGNTHWIMRPWLRMYSFVNKIRRFQDEIRELSSIEQGYCFVSFKTSNWEYGEITIRHHASGGPDWVYEFRSRKDLLATLEHYRDEVKAMDYPKE